MKTYTINGKEYAEIDIRVRCAELMGYKVKKCKSTSICAEKGFLYYVFCRRVKFPLFNPCQNPSDTDAIIDNVWDELNLKYITNVTTTSKDKDVYKALNSDLIKTKWEVLIKQHNCTKLVAACICFIEVNEGV